MIISKIEYIDYHVSLEPLRLLTEPMFHLQGDTQWDVRTFFQNHEDNIRKRLMREPRGHGDMYGAVLTKPINQNSLFGVLFMYSTGMSPLCGHGMIAVARAAVDLGYLRKKEGFQEFYVDAPVGRVKAFAEIQNGEVIRSGFDNAESYAAEFHVPIHVEGFGTIHVNVGYGGAFMVFVNEKELNLDILNTPTEKLIQIGMACKAAFLTQTNYIHPINKMESAVEGICLIIEKDFIVDGDKIWHKNFTIFGNRQYDRSPTGTGSSALAALLYKQGVLKPGMTLINYGHADVPFTIEIKIPENRKIPDSVIPTIGCRCFMTATGTAILEKDDPFPAGYSDKEDMI